MGGVGSGRRFGSWHGGKDGTGESLPLDVRELHRAGGLKPGARSSWRWWRGPDTAAAKANGASITTVGEGSDAVRLLYSHRGEPVEQRVALDWTPCHYGGARPWWRCPFCARRVAVIYGAGKYFACRHCYGLCYGCQKEDAHYRTVRRLEKIRAKLKDDGGTFDPLPWKPKGMHWETYSRLMKQLLRERQSSIGYLRSACGMD